VPPFKAFGGIAQDLIANGLPGFAAHMGDNLQRARSVALKSTELFENEKKTWSG